MTGEPGDELTLELLLRVVADVGLVGLPNVGKSSLLARMTQVTANHAPSVGTYRVSLPITHAGNHGIPLPPHICLRKLVPAM